MSKIIYFENEEIHNDIPIYIHQSDNHESAQLVFLMIKKLCFIVTHIKEHPTKTLCEYSADLIDDESEIFYDLKHKGTKIFKEISTFVCDNLDDLISFSNKIVQNLQEHALPGEQVRFN